MTEPSRLSDAEMIEILEDIARNGKNQAARIAAIKVLREIHDGEQPVADGFAELDAARAKLKAV